MKSPLREVPRVENITDQNTLTSFHALPATAELNSQRCFLDDFPLSRARNLEMIVLLKVSSTMCVCSTMYRSVRTSSPYAVTSKMQSSE